MAGWITWFTTNICHLLSNPSRNPSISRKLTKKVNTTDYRFESTRLKSFKNWPCGWIKPEKLAAAGFYYTGKSDIVKCFECQIEMLTWQPYDDVMLDHQRCSERCSFIRNYPCGNVPIGADPDKIPPFMPRGYDVCGIYNDNMMKSRQLEKEILEDTGVKSTEKISSNLSAIPMIYPEYANYDARLSTYERWPHKTWSQTNEQLAVAGLFYTGCGDETLCYHCGVGLKDWKPEDDPWEEHAKWSKHCSYLHMVKGTDYINRVTGEKYVKSDITKLSAIGEDLKFQKIDNDEFMAHESFQNLASSEGESTDDWVQLPKYRIHT